MTKFLKAATVSSLLLVSGSALAWGNGPFGGFNDGFGDMMSDVFGDTFGDGNGSFDMSMSGGGRGYGNGYGRNRYQGYQGYQRLRLRPLSGLRLRRPRAGRHDRPGCRPGPGRPDDARRALLSGRPDGPRRASGPGRPVSKPRPEPDALTGIGSSLRHAPRTRSAGRVCSFTL